MDVAKISSCRVNTTSRQGMKQLGISFGSDFLLFSFESIRTRRAMSEQPGKIPGPQLLMTALYIKLYFLYLDKDKVIKVHKHSP